MNSFEFSNRFHLIITCFLRPLELESFLMAFKLSYESQLNKLIYTSLTVIAIISAYEYSNFKQFRIKYEGHMIQKSTRRLLTAD